MARQRRRSQSSCMDTLSCPRFLPRSVVPTVARALGFIRRHTCTLPPGRHHGHRRQRFQDIRVPRHPLIRESLQTEAARQDRPLLPGVFRRHAPHRSLEAVSCKSDRLRPCSLFTLASIYSILINSWHALSHTCSLSLSLSCTHDL